MNRVNKVLLAGFIASLFLLVGCKKDHPKGFIKASEMEEVLYDYQMAQAMADNLPYEEIYKRTLFTDYVFQKYNITQAQFDSSMVWYTREAGELTKIYENVNKRLKAQQMDLNHQIALRDKKPMATAKGDTVDIWYKDRVFQLSNSPVSNKLLFKIPADDNFKINDEFVWMQRFTFIGHNHENSHVVMSMSVCLTNDSVINITKPVSRSGISSVRLKTDSINQIKEISGFVYYASENMNANLLLDQITLTRYHKLKAVKVNTNTKADPHPNPAKEVKTIKEMNTNTVVYKRVPEIELPPIKEEATHTTDTATQKPDAKPMRKNPRELDHPRIKKQ